VVAELVDWGAVWAGSLVPATRRTWRAASVLLLQNTETARRVERVQPVRSTLLNHALFTQVPPVAATRAEYLLWAAPLESRKGPRLAVRALARTPEHVRLVMVGDGPERRAVERLARRLDVAHRLELRGWVPRDEVLELMGGAAGVIFTGLREEGGLALAEAMLSGAPVIVLAHGGARTIAERAVDAGRVALIEPTGLSAAAQEMARAMTRFVDHPPGGSGPLLDQEAARRELEAAFRSALEGSPPD
jgi:glycosyltransferase involved in cell wall biosynthesis